MRNAKRRWDMAARKRSKGRSRNGYASGPWGTRSNPGKALPGSSSAKDRKKERQRIRLKSVAHRRTHGEAGPSHPTVAHSRRELDTVPSGMVSAVAVHASPSKAGGERQDWFKRLLITTMVPGRVFSAMDRPISSLVCVGLQASLIGWLPAAIWAAFATTRVRRKQRALAARLRPG